MRPRRAILLFVTLLFTGLPCPGVTHAQSSPEASPDASHEQSPEPGRIALASAEMMPWRDGAGMVVRLSLDPSAGDAGDRPRNSRWILFEDDVPLPRRHALHDDIATLGRGRYSHWGDRIIFTASDGTDPRTNGRRYELRRTPRDVAQVRFVEMDRMLVLNPRDRLWLEPGSWSVTTFTSTDPRDPRVPVNPSSPREDAFGLWFESEGEYRVTSSTFGALRVLVVDTSVRDAERFADVVVTFVASNSTGGTRDVPTPGPDEQRRLRDLLFRTHRAFDVPCGSTAQLARDVLDALDVETRMVWWLGLDSTWWHIGLEVNCGPDHGWRYYDPHFGVRGDEAHRTAITLLVAIRDEHARPVPGSAFEALTLADTDRTVLRQTFLSSVGALRLGGVTTSDGACVLVLDDDVRRVLPDAWSDETIESGPSGTIAFVRRMYRRPPPGEFATGTETPER